MPRLVIAILILFLGFLTAFIDKADEAFTPNNSFFEPRVKAGNWKFNADNKYQNKIFALLSPDENKVYAEYEFSISANRVKNINKIIFEPVSRLKLPPYFSENEELDFIKFNITKLFINGESADLSFENSDNSLVIKFDSCLAIASPSKIRILYNFDFPSNGEYLGRARGRNFFFLSHWIPKFISGTDSAYISFDIFRAITNGDLFESYYAKIKTPKNYTAVSSGILIEKTETRDFNEFEFVSENAIDFSWAASDDMIFRSSRVEAKGREDIKLNILLQPENEKYLDRYINAVSYSLIELNKFIGKYPYDEFTLVDLPRSCNISEIASPGLITIKAELFSSITSRQPEYSIAKNAARMYFGCFVGLDKSKDAWLEFGLSNYIADKILDEYYETKHASFNLFGHYPINGLNLLSYNEIPLIYSLGKFPMPSGFESLEKYIKAPYSSAISDSAFGIPDRTVYFASIYAKPELTLLTLENYFGRVLIMQALNRYYKTHKFKKASTYEFINSFDLIKNPQALEAVKWTLNESSISDYKIENIKYNQKANEYEVIAARIGGGRFEQTIIVYLEGDSIKFNWDGKDKWKSFYFKTDKKVYGAEIDPYRRNMLDINWANNSYTINKQYGGSISVSVMWFFWMQNLLLALGSIG